MIDFETYKKRHCYIIQEDSTFAYQSLHFARERSPFQFAIIGNIFLV